MLLALAAAWGAFGDSGFTVEASSRLESATTPNPWPVVNRNCLRFMGDSFATFLRGGSNRPLLISPLCASQGGERFRLRLNDPRSTTAESLGHHQSTYRNSFKFINPRASSAIAAGREPRRWVCRSRNSVAALRSVVGGFAEQHTFPGVLRRLYPGSQEFATGPA